jgi:signal transduction histidine kinase
VFRPFFRLDAARNQDEDGSGLGLAIALDIARSHAATLRWATARRGGYGQRCGCRYSLKLISQRFEQDEKKMGNRVFLIPL